jgi:hypothetical protein
LNRDVTNGCVDTGLASSVAGNAPLTDMDGEARGPSIDRGADDAP